MFPFYSALSRVRSSLKKGSWMYLRSRLFSSCHLELALTCPVRNLKTCRMLLNNYSEDSHLSKGNKEKKHVNLKKINAKENNPIISLITEDNEELVMTLKDAEKYAKRRLCSLERLENQKEKIKYRMVKATKVFEHLDINKQNNLKKILIKEDIAAHDLEIKVNKIFKSLKKGDDIVILLNNVRNQNKANFILETIEKSKLNEFLVQKVSISRGYRLKFQNSVSEKKSENMAEKKNNVLNEKES